MFVQKIVEHPSGYSTYNFVPLGIGKKRFLGDRYARTFRSKEF